MKEQLAESIIISNMKIYFVYKLTKNPMNGVCQQEQLT